MSKMPLSYSRLSCFETCQQQFDYLYVTKCVKDPGNVHTEYGIRVHESLETYAKTKDAAQLTVETVKYGPVVDAILRKQGAKYFEHQMAINGDMQPCDWFAQDVWVRSIADVLLVDGRKAYCLDWKTGKVKDNPTQMQLFACMVMLHFPEVDEVKTSFIWLAHDKTTEVTYSRAQFPLLWEGLSKRFAALQDTVDLGVFKAKPSRLCNWCAAKKICSYA